MNGVTLAHVSDLHLPFEPERPPLLPELSKRQLSIWSWNRRKHLHRMEVLDALRADLHTHDVEHVAITGDTVNFSFPEEYRLAASWLESLARPDDISLVPGNHDALVAIEARGVPDLWSPFTRLDPGWPFVHHRGQVALIGLNSALPTAPLLARGRLGPIQLERLEEILLQERAAGRLRVILVHHPLTDGAVGWRKALADRRQLQSVLRRVGAELVLHGHARDSRFDTVAGPVAPIPCLCVPSSSALPNPKDEGARWHRLRLSRSGGIARAEILVRRWSCASQSFENAGLYTLLLPRG